MGIAPNFIFPDQGDVVQCHTKFPVHPGRLSVVSVNTSPGLFGRGFFCGRQYLTHRVIGGPVRREPGYHSQGAALYPSFRRPALKNLPPHATQFPVDAASTGAPCANEWECWI